VEEEACPEDVACPEEVASTLVEEEDAVP